MDRRLHVLRLTGLALAAGAGTAAAQSAAPAATPGENPQVVEPRVERRDVQRAGIGLRGYLTNRFLLQAEYRGYVVFTSRDDNEEIDEWTVGFTYFF